MICYSAKIIENDKVRFAECHGNTPGDALLLLVQLKHIRKGATVRLGSAMWVGDTYVCANTAYRHMPECSTESASAWKLLGTDHIEWIVNNPC